MSVPRYSFHNTSFHAQSAFGIELDGLRVYVALGGLHTCSQRLGRIVLQNRHTCLYNDRSVIILVVNEVHRAACYFAAGSKDCFVDVVAVKPLPAKGRQERRVNIQDPSFEFLGNSEPRHEPG